VICICCRKQVTAYYARTLRCHGCANKPRRPRARYTPPAVVETRKVSFEDIKREFEEAMEEES
jgi:hypothetical protein